MEGGRGSEKLKKGMEVGAKTGLLRRGETLALFLFHFFKVYHFYIWKLLYEESYAKFSKTELENIP